MIAPFFIAGFDTPSDLCCRIRLYNKGLCPLTPEFIALGFRRSKKEQHQVLLLQTSNNNYGWNKYHAGIFGEVNSTPYPCKSKFKSEVWDNWNLIFQLTNINLSYQLHLICHLKFFCDVFYIIFIFNIRKRQRRKHLYLLRCLFTFAIPIKLYFDVFSNYFLLFMAFANSAPFWHSLF